MPLSMGMLKSPSNIGGSAPVIASYATYGSSTATTSHAIPMPSGIVAGDLLVILFGTADSVTHTMPSGWTTHVGVAFSGFTGVTLATYKIATGSEGSTATITTSANARDAAVALRITGGRSGLVNNTDYATFGAVLGNTSTPNPGSVTPAWGSANNLWLQALGMRSNSVSVSAYPTGYTLGQIVASTSGGVSNYRIAVSGKQLLAATEDADAYTLSGSTACNFLSPVIRPPS